MRLQEKVQLRWLAVCATIGSLSPYASAVITIGGTGNNYTPPPDGVGNYEGDLGSFTGTTISSNVLVSATHIGSGTTSTFTFGGATYNVQMAASLDDLALWEIAPNATGSFSTYAPLYTGSSEVNSPLIVVGRSVARGAAITGGWDWSTTGSGPFSWGTNAVAAIDTDGQLGQSGAFGGDFLQFDFDNDLVDVNEGIIANYDSGGGVFVDNNGVYQLAGVNSLVNTVLDSSGNPVSASLYDEYGYYYKSAGQLAQIKTHTPESSFATRISSKMNLIGVVDGSILPGSAASDPINNDGNLSIYANMTTGAITGGALLTIGGPNLPTSPATLQIAPNSGVSQIDSLTIDSGSTLDITNNRLILSNTDSSIQTTILGYLASGYNGGHWNGTGIISSTAASGSGLYGVGYASGNVAGASGLSSGQIEIAYTLYGDTNLDGAVNSLDFSVLASNFGKKVSGGWQVGDFAYDGVVSSVDFGLFADNFGKSASGASVALSAGDWAALDAFAAANGISLSSVPEPASVGFVGIVGLGILTRRRRRC
ncbi:MAG TPA: PEP-CTERM sorting domain-containing protein [Tepidisphaeraceae bacterium]|jgi:hypothetical protein|nr:PEP-CTERM sorting domain-containing protein [Tepidisphaeraceae bacterium]